LNLDWICHDPVFETDALSPLFRSESAWRGHLRFGYDFIRNARPATVVELGTHYGASFFSFCQGAKDGSPDTRLHAVDSWEGDFHSGAYGSEVFQLVSRAAALYPQAALHRAAFDEALDAFADGSIDLLHIDGLHTYEAVRRDYESWLPKLAGDGIVLLHDTEVRIADFGVWRLWRELSGQHPAKAFQHSAGLGILAPKGLSAAANSLFAEWQSLNRYYADTE